MWPGRPLDGPAGLRSKPSGAVPAGRAGDPGTTTEDRPLALGAGGYGMSVWLFSFLAGQRRGLAAGGGTPPRRPGTGRGPPWPVLLPTAATADHPPQARA